MKGNHFEYLFVEKEITVVRGKPKSGFNLFEDSVGEQVKINELRKANKIK